MDIKFKTSLLLVIFGMILFNCGSASKTMESEAGTGKLDGLVSGKSFEISSDRAMPMATTSLNSVLNSGLLPPGSSASQISLIGNPNYVKVMGDSVAVYLPYYGERQMGGGYDTNGSGIEFEGVPKEMEIEKNNDKQRYDIRFKMADGSETFNVNIRLFPNLSSAMNVNSSQRFAIGYSGTVNAIADKKQ